MGPASAFVAVHEKFERLNDTVQRYLTPFDLKFVVSDKKNERLLEHVPSEYGKITLVKALEITNADALYQKVQRDSGVTIYPLTQVLEITDELVRSVLTMKKHI